MNRDLTSVLGDILGCVPFESAHLSEDLTRLREGIPYTAPESMRIRWEQLEAILLQWLPDPPTEEWQWKIIDIVQGRKIARPA